MEDSGKIAKTMNNYVFDICFNPDMDKENIFHFLDYCLSNLTSTFLTGNSGTGFAPTQQSLISGLDREELQRYWSSHREMIQQKNLTELNREVVTANYIANYRDDLKNVISVLNDLCAKPDDLT